MSLLLDALNKADRERKRNETTPGIDSNHERINSASSHKKVILITALAVTSFLLLLASIYWLGQKSAKKSEQGIAETSASAQQASAKSKSIPAQSKQASTSTLTTNSASKNSAEDIDTSDESVASLYQQNTQTQPSNATLTLNAPDTTPDAAPTVDVSKSPAPTAGSPTSINQFANLPDLHDLPNQVLEKIPSLNYSEHNFNANGGNVKINGVIHHANDQLAPGLVIDKILEDGMILHTDNYSFKMRALNSWVNM